MTVEKPKPKLLLRLITTGVNSAINQSEFLVITCNSLKARENSRVHGTIGFGFASHWLKNWRESFKPITKRSNRNHVITFDSHFKTALNHRNQLHSWMGRLSSQKSEALSNPTTVKFDLSQLVYYQIFAFHFPTDAAPQFHYKLNSSLTRILLNSTPETTAKNHSPHTSLQGVDNQTVKLFGLGVGPRKSKKTQVHSYTSFA